MIKMVLEKWIQLGYIGIYGANQKVPFDWADRLAIVTNTGIGLMVCGVVMKVLLRIMGLGNTNYVVLVSFITITIMYLFIYNKIGLKVKTINDLKPSVRLNELNKIIVFLSSCVLFLFPIVCFVLMILLMIVF